MLWVRIIRYWLWHKPTYHILTNETTVGMAGASNTYATGDHFGFVLGYIGKYTKHILFYNQCFLRVDNSSFKGCSYG